MSFEDFKSAFDISQQQERQFRCVLHTLHQDDSKQESAFVLAKERLAAAERAYEGKTFPDGATDGLGRLKKSQKEWRAYYIAIQALHDADASSIRERIMRARDILVDVDKQISRAESDGAASEVLGLRAVLGVRQVEVVNLESELERHAMSMETTRNSLGQTLRVSCAKALKEEQEKLAELEAARFKYNRIALDREAHQRKVGEAETKLRDSEQRTSCLQQCLRPFIKRAEINKAKAIRVRFEKSENLGLELVPASKERLLLLLEAIEQGSCATAELANSYLDEAARIVRGAEVRVVPVWCVSQFCYFGVVVRTAGII